MKRIICFIMVIGCLYNVMAQNSAWDVKFIDLNDKSKWADEPGAKEAVEAAMDVMSLAFFSSVPIQVDVYLYSFSKYHPNGKDNSNTLAITRPYRRRYGKLINSNDPRFNKDAWYDLPLAEKLHGSKFNARREAAEIHFNKDQKFSYRTSAPFIGLKQFLMSVAIHEFMHVLGFGTTIGYSSQGNISKFSTPSIMEFFIHNSNGDSLINQPTSGHVFESFITANDLFFTGVRALDSNNQQSIPIHSPAVFANGSTGHHIKDGYYPLGTNNALMEPYKPSGFFFEHMGGVSLGIMQDIGWDARLNVDELGNSVKLWEMYPNPVGTSGVVNIDLYFEPNKMKSIKVLNLAGNTMITLESDIQRTIIINTSGLAKGIYFVRIELKDGRKQTQKLMVI